MKVLILDVDGIITDGKFYYNKSGKVYKCFSADDADSLSILSNYMQIEFVSGDRRGFDISRKRVEDMGYKISLVSTVERIEWISAHYNPGEVIYMGDGVYDALVMENIGYGITTADSDMLTAQKASYRTTRKGGDRAVSEACKHILKKFFMVDITNIEGLKAELQKCKSVEGRWAV